MNQALKTIRRLEHHGLALIRSDESELQVSNETLRRGCPCAGCKALRGDQSHQKPIGGSASLLNIVESTKEEELHIEKIWPVGNYALGIKWGDGHNDGIYTYEYLLELATASS